VDVDDVDAQVRAVERAVVDGERQGRATRSVVVTRRYPDPVDDVWSAITDPERLPRWFLPVSGDLRPGGRYQLEGNAGGDIEVCEPPRHLAVTWVWDGDVSWVDVRLHEEPGGGTRLVLEHVAHPADHWDDYGPGAVGLGWDLAVLGLSLHLAGGEAIDPADAAAWAGSPQGHAFLRASGDEWCRADVAGGADAGRARAAADRTLAAYTAPPDDPGHAGLDAGTGSAGGRAAAPPA
jgi:uncharacterized protein YndB with AHSA1/START domain